MKILSIDTASNICSVAILEDENLIKEISLDDLKTHSEKLMPMLEEIFKATNLSLEDIDLVVCDKGPGSFTGIRIGVATVIAFSDSLDVKTIGISSLEALAYNVKTPGIICSLIDANNSNVYFAVFNLQNNSYSIIENFGCDSISDVISKLQKYDEEITFVGDGAINYKDLICSSIKRNKFTDNNNLNSYSLGLAGLNNYNLGNFQDVMPLYLRKSQAERMLEEKLNGNS